MLKEKQDIFNPQLNFECLDDLLDEIRSKFPDFEIDEDGIEFDLNSVAPFPYPKRDEQIKAWKMIEEQTYYKGSWKDKKPEGNGIMINSEG